MSTNQEVCYGEPIRTASSQQEWYESAARTARIRASKLRKAGFRVYVSAMGDQVTNVGRVKMTLVTIEHAGREVPAPAVVIPRSL